MKIDTLFQTLRQRGEVALMPYLTAGYPTLDGSLDALRRIADAGADLIEVGVPFSDPVADGPTIQASSRRALAQGTRLEIILAAFSRCPLQVPLVLMSYVNPLLAYGRERLFDDLAGAGFCGLIVPDLPLEESDRWRADAREHGLGWIPLIAPTSGIERGVAIAAQARGFAYYVSVSGTTGTRRRLPARLTSDLNALRARTETPVAVGFGVNNGAQVRELAPHCDGVIVGSRLIEALRDDEPLESLIRELKQATKEPTPC